MLDWHGVWAKFCISQCVFYELFLFLYFILGIRDYNARCFSNGEASVSGM